MLYNYINSPKNPLNQNLSPGDIVLIPDQEELLTSKGSCFLFIILKITRKTDVNTHYIVLDYNLETREVSFTNRYLERINP